MSEVTPHKNYVQYEDVHYESATSSVQAMMYGTNQAHHQHK